MIDLNKLIPLIDELVGDSTMSDMQMTFFSSYSTPLYSSAWNPHTTGQYAATCVFLILLAAFLRSLFALKHLTEKKWLDRALNRRYVVVAGKLPEAERTSEDGDGRMATLLTKRGLEETVRVVRRGVREVQPWRLSVDAPRAALVTVMVGVGYLLMLAVMTLNVGYFLSILGGSFLGELVFGRYGQLEEH